jgi:hypothetical protein
MRKLLSPKKLMFYNYKGKALSLSKEIEKKNLKQNGKKKALC